MSNLMVEGALPSSPELHGDVALDADSRAVLLREIREQVSGFGFLVSLLSDGKAISRQMAHSVLYMAESRTAQMCKLTGTELDSAKEREERYVRIRSLNEKIRELKEELGKSGSVSQTAAHLKMSYDTLYEWWRRDGFGHISEFAVNQYGCMDVKFSCMLFGDFRVIDSSTPVSDKERKRLWFESLRARGFNVREDPSDRDLVLVDCDQNRHALGRLFSENFPSAEILETTSHRSSRGEFMVLKDVRVLFREMQEVIDIPRQGKDAI